MPQFRIGCEWRVRGYARVTAKTLKEAMDMLDDIPTKQLHGEYIDDSFEVLKGKGDSYQEGDENEVEVASGAMTWESDGIIRHIDHSGNCTDVWRPGDVNYEENKNLYFPDHEIEDH